MYAIGEVVEQTGMSQHTLRLYEDAGFFINPIERDPRGNRVYDEDDVDWLRRCGLLRGAGMPVAEISRYVRLVREDAPVADRIAVLEQHRDRVAGELRDAEERLALMEEKIALYRDHVAAGAEGAPWPEATPHPQPRGGTG